MKLKRCEEIEWQDVPRIELPSIAVSIVDSSLWMCRDEQHWLQEYRDFADGVGGQSIRLRGEGLHQRFLDKVRRAEILLVHGSGSQPLTPLVHVDSKEGDETWTLDGSLDLVAQYNVQRMLNHAYNHRGLWSQVINPLQPQSTPETTTQENSESLTVLNPRWEHVDGEARNDRPDFARDKDSVTLMVDVTGASNGTLLTFKLYDTSQSPRKRYAVVRGDVQDGIGMATWKVAVKKLGIKLEFAGEVRRVSSEMAAIPLAKKGVKFNFIITDVPGKDGLPLPYCDWRIVRSGRLQEAFWSDDVILAGESDTEGRIVLSEEDQGTLQTAIEQTPEQLWIITPGQARRILIDFESDQWTDEDKLFRALDASGYTDQLRKVQGSAANTSFFAAMAKEEFCEESGEAILARLKG